VSRARNLGYAPMLINEGYSYHKKFQKGKQHLATKFNEKIEKKW
jgi:hypothetical protein